MVVVSIDDHILVLLDRLRLGECTPEEQEQIAEWIAADPGHRAESAIYGQLLGQVRRVEWTGGSPEATLHRVREILAREERGATAARVAPVRIVAAVAERAAEMRWATGMSPARMIVAAACAAGILVAAGLSAARVIGTKSGRQPFREFTTAAGNRATVTLRDGTQLVLGPATTLRVPADFGRGTRAVALDGQALFTVVHDAAHPFSVRTARAVVTDVGTKFAVQAYAGDGMERIAVAEGEVAVAAGRGADRDHPVRAGDIAVITDTALAIAHRMDMRADLAWVQGGLAFQATPLADAVRQMARTFDLSITIADSSLAREAITASFGDDSADEVLDVVTRTIGAQYERTGRSVVIRRRTAAAHGGHIAPSELLTAGAPAAEPKK